MTADVVIVGGGVAGLVAARRLVLGGRSVVLLEASVRLVPRPAAERAATTAPETRAA